MDNLLGLLVGIGLSAACGFRVFVPLLGLAVASAAGHLDLSAGFAWIGSTPAIVAFSIATLLEVGAYYLPWLDNLLDTLSVPAAVVAGTMMTAAMAGDMSPWLKWSLAAIAGGGLAGTISAGTAAVRGAATVYTGGAANPAVATGELAGAAGTTVLAVAFPAAGALVAAAALAAAVAFLWRLIRRRAAAPYQKIA